MKLKEKIRNHEKTIGMHVNLSDISVAYMAGLAGFDFIWIDMEHNNLSVEKLMGHIIAVRAGGTDVIVRVPQDDLTFTKKILEMGPDGIIFPMVHNAGEAERLIGSTLYPPAGSRGFGPMGAVDYGYKNALEYVRSQPDDLCRFIQIENTEVIGDLDRVTQNPYIDGYIWGPCDFSGSIGEMLNVFGENETACIRAVTERLHEAGKYVGLSTGDTDADILQHWHDLGIDMISAGADFGFVQQMCLQTRKTLERIHKNA